MPRGEPAGDTGPKSTAAHAIEHAQGLADNGDPYDW